MKSITSVALVLTFFNFSHQFYSPPVERVAPPEPVCRQVPKQVCNQVPKIRMKKVTGIL